MVHNVKIKDCNDHIHSSEFGCLTFRLEQRLKNRTRSVESQLSGFVFLRSCLSVRFYAVYPDVPETVKLIVFSPKNERQLRR